MKNKFINLNSGSFTRPGVVTAAAVACGYWVSQISATNFVNSVVMGISPVIAGVFCFAIFGALFVFHLVRPLPKAAAVLGLGSFGVFTIAMAVVCSPNLDHYLPSPSYAVPIIAIARYAFFISTLLGVAGVALDANRCLRGFRTDSDFEI